MCTVTHCNKQWPTYRRNEHNLLHTLEWLQYCAQHTAVAHTAVAHTAVAHTAVAHTAAAHTAVAHTVAAHTAVAHTAAAHTAVAHTAVAHTTSSNRQKLSSLFTKYFHAVCKIHTTKSIISIADINNKLN